MSAKPEISVLRKKSMVAESCFAATSAGVGAGGGACGSPTGDAAVSAAARLTDRFSDGLSAFSDGPSALLCWATAGAATIAEKNAAVTMGRTATRTARKLSVIK